jgi:hypothetical protein
VRILANDRGASPGTWRAAAAAVGVVVCVLATVVGGWQVIEAEAVIDGADIALLGGSSAGPDLLEGAVAPVRLPIDPPSIDARTRGADQPPAGAAVHLRVTESDASDVRTAAPVSEIDASPVFGAFNANNPATVVPSGTASALSAGPPWRAAADGGVAIGRESRAAAVATAGYFTRLGKRIGGSF